MPLNWAFTAHWFASFGGADRRLTEQGRNRGDGTPSSSTAWTTSSVNELYEGRFERDVGQRTVPGAARWPRRAVARFG